MSASQEDPVPAELRRHIESDPWARSLGIRFLDLRRGYSRLSLRVEPHMVNFQGYPHGSVIFSIADMAFGAACNSHGGTAVAVSVTIDFLAAVPPGTTLVAECRERKRGRRAAFYDVSVTAEDGPLVASAHCIAHRVD